jgi:hypothetical protein
MLHSRNATSSRDGGREYEEDGEEVVTIHDSLGSKSDGTTLRPEFAPVTHLTEKGMTVEPSTSSVE